MIDAYQISYLGAGRDVLRWGAAVSGLPEAPLVGADPDFDLGASLSGKLQFADGLGDKADWQTKGLGGEDRRQTEVCRTALEEVRGRRSRDASWSAHPFTPLPGTRAEGERIAALLGVEPLMAGRALEQRIKQCRSPRILHLATHGFFLKDQPRDLNREARGQIGRAHV